MKVIIANRLYVQDATPEAFDWARKNLVLNNPDFYKKLKMGKWTGNTPENIYLYERMGDDLWLPFGCMESFLKQFPDCLIKVNIQPIRRVSYRCQMQLYHYQEKALEAALKKKNGVLVMPCGAGKTQTGLAYVSAIGGRTLWLTHTQDLLNQSMKRALSVFGLAKSEYGTITAGKVNCGSAITFATVQTLSKIDLSQYRDYWDVVVVDECQHCAGSPTKVTQFYKVISRLSARYKLGLTATPKRADGLEQSMFALLGGIVHETTRTEVADTTCPVQIKMIDTGYVPDYDVILMGDGTIDYAALVSNLIEDQKRFDRVLDVINRLQGPTMVLANRVDYIDRLSKQYTGRAVCLSTLGQSKAAKAQRKEVLRELNEGIIDAVFATYQLAKEGLDVPNLRHVVFATPEKDETTVVQSVGRVARKSPGKEFGQVIDFVDDFGMYRGWAKKRQGYYKKIGCRG